MKNNSQTSPLSITFILLAMVALIAGLFLVRQNQETRKGAYFSGAKLLVQPVDVAAKVGDNVPVQLWVQTDNSAKVSSVDTSICYGSGLKLEATDVSTLVTPNQDAFKVIEYIKDANSCLRLVVVSSGIDPANLKSGMVKVADIRFKAMTVGSGDITLDSVNSMVNGYNPTAGATDSTMKLASANGAKYVISAGNTTGGTCGWCGATCMKKFSDTVCTQQVPPANKTCETQGDTCVMVDVAPTSKPTSQPTNAQPTSKPTNAQPTNAQPTSKPTSQPTNVQPTSQPTSAPTSAPTSSVGSDKVLKFRMASYGINGAAACATADKMPLIVTVRANDGTNKTYTNVMSTRANNSDNVAFYDVTLSLAGFGYGDNVSVFIKSPKSLQVKYGVDGQQSFYNKAGGELMGLTNDAATTKVFSFEKYPLLMGDVTGPDGVQDGVVDGLDFSFVKAESNKRTSVAEGGYMLADLNGNCQMESQDLSNLMLSLSVKQGQLY